MKVAIASDHRGFAAKNTIKAFLENMGHIVEDFGCHTPESCDYPDHGFAAARHVAGGDAELGVLMCGTGIGMSITANKIAGIRAALCHDELTAELARRHNNANVLCMPADLIGEALMKRVVEVWLKTQFEAGRHERRVKKIMQFETDSRSG